MSSVVEALESRRLLSAAVVGNVLQVTGTTGPDVITLTSDGTTVVVNDNGTQTSFALSSFTTATILGGNGNDIIVIDGAVLGVYVNGEVGNDKIVGGDANETLYGGAGKDQIDGRLGNDKLNGNGGNDKLFGNAGADRMYAGLGDDYLDGGSSADRMFPEDGTDTVFGQSGDDNIRSKDDFADQIFGGSGEDTCICNGSDVRSSIEVVAII